MALPVDTPCIGICSTIYGDEICRGCQRTYLEIIEWNRYSAEEKQAIFNRLNTQIIAVTQPVLTITDADLLKQQLDKFNVRYRPEASPLTWALALLRVGKDRIQDLAKYGVQVQSPYDQLSLTELYDSLEQTLQRNSHELYFRSLAV